MSHVYQKSYEDAALVDDTFSSWPLVATILPWLALPGPFVSEYRVSLAQTILPTNMERETSRDTQKSRDLSVTEMKR